MGTPEREAMFAIIYQEHLLGCGRPGKATRDWASLFTEEHDVEDESGGRVLKQNISLEECPLFIGPYFVPGLIQNSLLASGRFVVVTTIKVSSSVMLTFK